MDPVRISAFDFYRYALKLSLPISGKEKAKEREGLIIHFKSAEGAEGFGDVAPFPGRSRESVQDCLDQIKGLKKFLLSVELPKHLERLDGGFERIFKDMYLKPSLRFGVETALLTLLANGRKVSLRGLLSTENHDHIKLNGLIYDQAETLDEKTAQARQMIGAGFQSIKLKVGSDLKKEIKTVQAFSEAIDGRALFYVDANQTWTLNQAVEFGNEVGLAALAYIEEPFKNIYDIPEFFAQTTIPIALDESLLKYPFEEIKSIDGVYTLILKPTLLGGIERAWKLMHEAKRLALSSVVSSTFESDIGILGLAHLAGSTSRDYPAGLDTLKYFEQNLLKEKIPVNHGKMDISRGGFRADQIRFDLLTKIEI